MNNPKLLTIHTYPDPILKKIAQPVGENEFDQNLEELCHNMLYTMYQAPGIGLAAPQVGVSKRIFVMDISYEREEAESGEIQIFNQRPKIIINPEFISKDGEILYQEGCLSLPGLYEEIKRFEKIKIRYQNLDGSFSEEQVEGLESICMQHENDHLDGIVFIDYLGELKQAMAKKKLLKAKKKRM